MQFTKYCLNFSNLEVAPAMRHPIRRLATSSCRACSPHAVGFTWIVKILLLSLLSARVAFPNFQNMRASQWFQLKEVWKEDVNALCCSVVGFVHCDAHAWIFNSRCYCVPDTCSPRPNNGGPWSLRGGPSVAYPLYPSSWTIVAENYSNQFYFLDPNLLTCSIDKLLLIWIPIFVNVTHLILSFN